MVNCFFAYPSKPSDFVETVELFIDEFNGTYSNLAKITSWKNIGATGRIIIDQVCSFIDKSEMFLCDLTYLNSNVLFELGYAISHKKQIWLAINSTNENAIKNFRKLGIISGIGYTEYQNSYDLTNRFLTYISDITNKTSIYDDLLSVMISDGRKRNSIFYLKSEINSDASIHLAKKIQSTSIPVITDDPFEISMQPFNWYLQNVIDSLAIVAHLSKEEEGVFRSLLQNEKYSLICGIAYGLDKPLIIFAHAPYMTPLDLKDLLFIHERSSDINSPLDEWLDKVNHLFIANTVKSFETISSLKSIIGLQKVYLGEYVAENEQNGLSNYFIPTASYQDALNSGQYLLYVGRKGSGKTANLYQIAEKLRQDKRNFVCVVKPVDYELEDVLRLLKSSISKTDPGFLLESLWKFLIYTELASGIYNQMNSRPRYIDLSEVEKNFVKFVTDNERLVLTEFTLRMEEAIEELCKLDEVANLQGQRAKVSEILHKHLLGELRHHLGDLLVNKFNVTVLVDNLDKAWEKGKSLKELSNFLFGLLSGGQEISRDLLRETSKFKGINFSLIIFIRSDIFNQIQIEARESDKLSFTKIDWNDHRLLLRVIEERFSSSLGQDDLSEDIWKKYFTPNIYGESTQNYILRKILPRPRDIIFFCKNALSNAINHKNSVISHEDILQAEKNYSEHVFMSLLAETEVRFNEIESFLYELAGSSEIITKIDIKQIMKKLDITESKIDDIIKLLCESTFLGQEIAPGIFEYLYEESYQGVYQSMAMKTKEIVGQERFKINLPFHTFLQIKS
jgi:hypothetical protein